MITITASPNAILAVDLGKYKSVACVHDPAIAESPSPLLKPWA
jgi:hypothetical protein